MAKSAIACLICFSAVQLTTTDYNENLKRNLWNSGEDPSPYDIGETIADNFQPYLYENQLWDTSGEKQQQLLSPTEQFTRSNSSDRSSVLNVVDDWPDVNKKLGQPSAVSIDVDGNIIVFHRGDRTWNGLSFLPNNIYNQRDLGPITVPTIVVFNATTGAVIKEWGTNRFYLPHGLTVDAENNIWVTDVALHQVFKYSPSQELLMSLGIAFVPGNDDKHFCKPSGVAVMSNGDFFVSDGYCNSRIMKFSKNGKLLISWGRSTLEDSSLGTSLPPYEFSIPHALALAEDKNLLCVADRENGRIQCFNCHNGTFMMQFQSRYMGTRLFSVAYSPIQGGQLYAVNGPGFKDKTPVKGFIISLATMQLKGEFYPNAKEFSNPHDVAVSSDGNDIYVVELNPYKVWKFTNVSAHGNLSTISEKRPLKKIIPNIDHKFQGIVSSPKHSAVTAETSAKDSHMIITAISILMGVIAVIAIFVFIAIVKLRRRGCLMGASSQYKRWDFPISQVEGFKLGQFLDRHQGFEKVSTEESDDEGSSNISDARQHTHFA